MILFCVNVFVLFVYNILIVLKFWIVFKFLMIVFFLVIIFVFLIKFVVMIIGSILGVKLIVIDNLKRKVFN